MPKLLGSAGLAPSPMGFSPPPSCSTRTCHRSSITRACAQLALKPPPPLALPLASIMATSGYKTTIVGFARSLRIFLFLAASSEESPFAVGIAVKEFQPARLCLSCCSQQGLDL
uniref:Uncharacterized protein n=1 Tax=Oryza meridionalis TaxID=40149 RepID=A0A0E0CP08_9ORYZ